MLTRCRIVRLAYQETPMDAAVHIPDRVEYQTHPSQYRHWKLSFNGPVATLAADFDENGGLRPGYKLKLNSYDLGVDIELNDAINRIRFEHPEVRTVVVTSARDKVFCSGANIFMLGVSSHSWKVNFCKFTNETRNGLEDSSKHSGLKFLAAVNGACAGGGYEMALACDEIILVDDRSSAVSLPEVPLLGVLPGTGGLTRVTDKRKVRHDLADIFCTTTEGVRGKKAKDWRLVDDIVKPAQFADKVQERALALAAQSDRPADGKGVALPPLQRTMDADALTYAHVAVAIDRAKRVATFTVKAPTGAQPTDVAGIEAAGAAWYPLQMARELEDAILQMRTNELDIGTWLIKTQGDSAAVLAMDATLQAHQNHWLVRETIGLLRRTFSRLDVSSRSLFALVEEGTCFAGSFLELALACDMRIASTAAKFAQSFVKRGLAPDWGGSYFLPRVVGVAKASEMIFTGETIDAAEALKLGIVNSVVAPEELMNAAYTLAKKIAAGPPITIALAKRTIHHNLEADLRSALEFETFAQTICKDTDDYKEGVKAFVEKRAPVFRGS